MDGSWQILISIAFILIDMHGIFGVSKKTQIQCQNILKHVMFLSTGWWFAPHLKATRQIGSFPPKDRGEPKKNV